jgi:hypothetical protein
VEEENEPEVRTGRRGNRGWFCGMLVEGMEKMEKEMEEEEKSVVKEDQEELDDKVGNID